MGALARCSDKETASTTGRAYRSNSAAAFDDGACTDLPGHVKGSFDSSDNSRSSFYTGWSSMACLVFYDKNQGHRPSSSGA